MKSLLIALMCSFSIISYGQNPFLPSVDPSEFVGSFTSKSSKLILIKEGAGLSGEISLNNNRYIVEANVENGQLKGTYSNGSKRWPFSLTKSGENFQFKTGAFVDDMKKLPQVDYTGSWDAQDIVIDVSRNGYTFSGKIYFKGNSYDFTAQNSIGGLSGNFGSGGNAFPFQLLPSKTKGKLVFQTEGFKTELRDKDEYDKLAGEQEEAEKQNARKEFYKGKLVDSYVWLISNKKFKLAKGAKDLAATSFDIRKVKNIGFEAKFRNHKYGKGELPVWSYVTYAYQNGEEICSIYPPWSQDGWVFADSDQKFYWLNNNGCSGQEDNWETGSYTATLFIGGEGAKGASEIDKVYFTVK